MARDTGDASGNWTPRGYCAVFACDIVAFGTRPDHVQARLREVMYAALRQALEASGLPPRECYQEDRGDGVIAVLPPWHDRARLAHPLPDHLRVALRSHNRLAVGEARMQLRVALHAGELAYDDNGMVGTTVNHTARLLDAPPFKQAIVESGAPLGLIVSDHFYRVVIESGQGGADPDEFRPLPIEVKETRETAWLCIRTPAQHDSARPVPVPDASVADVRAAAGAAQDRLPVPPVFEIVERLLDIPLLTTEDGRDELVASLRRDIRTRIPRHSRAQLDVLAIVRTCLEFTGGLEEFLALVRALVGESAQVRALEETVARYTP